MQTLFFFETINFFNLLLFLLLKKFGQKICWLNIENKLLKRFFNSQNQLYSDLHNHYTFHKNFYFFEDIRRRIIIEINNKKFENFTTYNLLKTKLLLAGKFEKKYQCWLDYQIYKDIYNLSQMIGISLMLLEKNQFKKIYIIPSTLKLPDFKINIFSDKILFFPFIRVLIFINFWLLLCNNLFKFFLKNLNIIFDKFILKINKKSEEKTVGYHPETSKKNIDISKYKILYFPHKNITYGEKKERLYIKNWYY